jgi:aminopeptidase
MDPRIREHARTVADHSTGIESGDCVVISAPAAAEDLVVALHEECAERGAHPVSVNSDSRATRAFLRNHDGDFETPEHLLAMNEEMDVYIAVRGDVNATETADVAPERTAAYRRAMKPVLQERLSKTWSLTHYPTSGHAQVRHRMKRIAQHRSRGDTQRQK